MRAEAGLCGGEREREQEAKWLRDVVYSARGRWELSGSILVSLFSLVFVFVLYCFLLVLMAGSLHGWGWVGWEALYCAVICIHTSLFPLNNLLSCTSSPLSFSFSFLPSVDITPLFACSLESWGWQDYNS